MSGAVVSEYKIEANKIAAKPFTPATTSMIKVVAQDASNILGRLAFPVSGYTTSVDWGGSALIEFTYLDMILAQHLTPAQAAEQLPRLLTFAGDESPSGSPYAAAGFRFFMPRQQKEDVLLWAGM